MRKYWTFLLLSLILSHSLFGQNVYFNKKYNLGTCSGADGVGALVVKGGYIICTSFSDTTCSLDNYSILNLDSLGNILWRKNYGRPKFIYGTWRLISTKDSGYVTSGSVQDTTYIKAFQSYDADIVLYKFKTNGDTAWVRRFADTNTYAEATDCKQTKDGGYIITGLYTDKSNPALASLLLMRTDSLGNLKWQKTYNYSTGTYQINNGYSIDITSDGGYIIGAECGSTSITQFSSLILKTDSLGNVKWKSIPISDGSAFVAATSDGGGIVACSYATTSQPLDELYVLKYSASGSIQWQKKYGPSVSGNYPWGIYVAKNGDYIVTGNTTTDSNQHTVGFITKVDTTGSMKWYGTYDIYKDTNDQNYLRDTKPTADGGYVACGFAWPQLAANGNQDTWVIKLDSNGCDTIGRCPIVNGINEISVGNNSVRVYPNPSKGVFNFKFTSQSEFVENKCTVEVYNMLGEKVYSNKFFNSQFSINIGNEPQGIYLYRVITNKGEVMGSGKLIIE